MKKIKLSNGPEFHHFKFLKLDFDMQQTKSYISIYLGLYVSPAYRKKEIRSTKYVECVVVFVAYAAHTDDRRHIRSICLKIRYYHNHHDFIRYATATHFL